MSYHFDESGNLKPPTPEQLAAADADAAIIVLDQGAMPDGSPYWAYVAVKPSKYGEFLQLTRARRPLRLTDYGVILQYGFDRHVPSAAIHEMKRKYDFDEKYLVKLAADVRAAQSGYLKQNESQRLGDIIAMLKRKAGWAIPFN